MSSLPLQVGSAPRTDAPIRPLHLILLLIVSAGTVAWGLSFLKGGSQSSFQEYLLLLGPFGMLTALFIFTRIREDHLRFFDLPIFLTIFGFINFGLAPLQCFLEPREMDQNLHGNYAFLVRALAYVLLGMAALWTGATLARSSRKAGARPETAGAPSVAPRLSILFWAGGLYAVSVAVRVYLLEHHLYSYVGSVHAYYQNLASMQVFDIVSGFGSYALIIVCIEKYLHPSSLMRRWVFGAVFASECVWGLISGMKGLLIQNFIIVALLATLIQRRFRKGWILLAFAVGLVVYPISNQYRYLVRTQGVAVTSMSRGLETTYEAMSEVAAGQSNDSRVLDHAWDDVVSRLDLLQYVGLIFSLGPRAHALHGKERWWMIPYYPFIPRLVWHSKPILDIGSKFSVALGIPKTTSTAITYPGDLYLDYGLLGIIAGMFLLGMVAQWLTNLISGVADKRRLFIYSAIFLTATNLEADVFSYWTALIKNLAIVAGITLVIYGLPRRRAGQAAPLPEKAGAVEA